MTSLKNKRAILILALIILAATAAVVAAFAASKSYDERKLTFVDGFTICAHTGAFDTPDNSIESIEAAINGGADIVEFDIRQRPDGAVIMSHDEVNSNSEGVEVDKAFSIIEKSNIKVNLDIKETAALENLYELIKAHSLENRVFMTGVEVEDVKDAKKRCPGIEYYVNFAPSKIRIHSKAYKKELLDMLEETGALGINCNHTKATQALSELLHENGYKLSVWTVDKKSQMKRALSLKPDNITTRKVDELKKVINNS